MSERFACWVVGQHRSTKRHTPASQTVEDPEAALRAWLREYAGEHPRWGHRRAYHDARGEGWTVNHKKIQRLWRKEGLRVVVKRRRKRLGPPRCRRCRPRPARTWCVGHRLPVRLDHRRSAGQDLSVVDEHTRECLGGLVERSITGEVLATELNRIKALVVVVARRCCG